MNYFEFFDTREDVLRYIERLKDQGYFEEDIHLVTEDPDFDALNYTAVHTHLHLPDNQLKQFFSKGENGVNFLRSLEFNDDYVNQYLRNVERGQYLVVTRAEDLKRRNQHIENEDNPYND